MSTSVSSQQLESYIPVYDVVPEKWEDARTMINEQLRKISNAINVREIGFFLDEELLSGKSFIPGASSPDDQVFRSMLRKVIVFGALPDSSTKTIPHGITVDSNFSIIDMYLSATDPIGLTGFSLQYWDSTGTAPITVSYDSTNVIVTTTGHYSNFTTSFIILEYIQEA
jgi:hypothetical protein